MKSSIENFRARSFRLRQGRSSLQIGFGGQDATAGAEVHRGARSSMVRASGS
jgi:hypothetical protein